MRLSSALFVTALTLWGIAWGNDRLTAWRDSMLLPPLSPQVADEVRAQDGQLLRAWQVEDGRWRLALPLDEVDPLFLEMLIAYEDRRFQSHNGVDLWAASRAALQAVNAGALRSGASTLTMQVARLLENSGTGAIWGKIRQIRLALALEQQLSKDEILQLYLLLAPYGGNLEGLRAASLSWLGKEPKRLTPSEAALLVALPQSPENRRPDRHPEAARQARDRVLARATTSGVISLEAAQSAMAEPVPSARRPFPALSPHLAQRHRPANPLANPVTLSIDARLQRQIEALARQALEGQPPQMQIAILIAEHQSGAIRASVGAADLTDETRRGFLDMTVALRSPGSLLKPLVYGMAFDDGLAHPETLLEDRPTDFAGYRPQNFDRRFRGTIRLREALQHSLNLPVVALTEAIGPSRFYASLEASGTQPKLPTAGKPGLAVALGGVGVSLTDMVTLYAMIARGGVTRPLSARIEDQASAEGRRVLSGVAAWQLGDILSGQGLPGLEGAGLITLPSRAGSTSQGSIAWKTGTSYGHRDAWALGFDGRYVIGVWMGRADGSAIPGAFGGALAAPVMAQSFARLGQTLTPLPPPPPHTLLVSNAALPLPLQRFIGAGQSRSDDNPLAIRFPRDGSVVEPLEEGVLLRASGGTPPYNWLLNGAPLILGLDREDSLQPLPAPGFVTLTVIDAEGRSVQSHIRLTAPPSATNIFYRQRASINPFDIKALQIPPMDGQPAAAACCAGAR